MSEEVKEIEMDERGNEVDNSQVVDIRKYYEEPFDIVRWLKGRKGTRMMSHVMNKAIEYYDENGVSPIVEQEKFKAFSIDYFFLVKCMSEFVENDIGGKIGNLVRASIYLDFSSGDEVVSNGKFLVQCLDKLEFLIASTSRKYLYSRTCYVNKNNGKMFVVSGIIINSLVFKKGGKLLDYANEIMRISSKKENEFKGVGPKKYQSFLESCVKDKKELFLFSD